MRYSLEMLPDSYAAPDSYVEDDPRSPSIDWFFLPDKPPVKLNFRKKSKNYHPSALKVCFSKRLKLKKSPKSFHVTYIAWGEELLERDKERIERRVREIYAENFSDEAYPGIDWKSANEKLERIVFSSKAVNSTDAKGLYFYIKYRPKVEELVDLQNFEAEEFHSTGYIKKLVSRDSFLSLAYSEERNRYIIDGLKSPDDMKRFWNKIRSAHLPG